MKNKLVHLMDYMTTDIMPMSTQVVSFGDDIYHDHDFYEICYVLSGSIKHIVNGQNLDLHAGDVLFLKPSDVHIFYRKDSNCKHRDFIFRKNFFEETCKFLDNRFLDNFKSIITPYKATVTQEQLSIFEKNINDFYLSENVLNDEEKIKFSKFFLINLLSILSFNQSHITMSKYPKWLTELLQLFNQSQFYTESISVTLSRFNYSQEYMCRVFKKYMGVTMTEYLNEVRLNFAQNQLKLTNNTIIFISQECGFSSVSYFTKIFKEKYGISPKKFRQQQS